MADERVYGFNKRDAQSLVQSIGNGRPPTGDNSAPNEGGYIVVTPAGGIPKRVGNTVTMVDCDAYYLAGTGSTRTKTAAGFKVPVGNYSTTADIAAGQDILPTMHGGALLANWEDC